VTAIFDQLVPDAGDVGEHFAARPETDRLEDHGEAHLELDARVGVDHDDAIPHFELLASAWADHITVLRLMGAMHVLELERAAVPDIVNVTVTNPAGQPMGHFRVDDNNPGFTTYVVGPPPDEPRRRWRRGRRR
jgi:hypothetical protein